MQGKCVLIRTYARLVCSFGLLATIRMCRLRNCFFVYVYRGRCETTVAVQCRQELLPGWQEPRVSLWCLGTRLVCVSLNLHGHCLNVCGCVGFYLWCRTTAIVNVGEIPHRAVRPNYARRQVVSLQLQLHVVWEQPDSIMWHCIPDNYFPLL